MELETIAIKAGVPKLRPIPNWDGYYASQDGRIVSTRTNGIRVLKPHMHKGYLRLYLFKSVEYRKAKFVHRLVAQAYIPNPHHYPEVNHIDGDRENNNVTNLEWCTKRYNELHKRYILGSDNKGMKNGQYGYKTGKLFPKEQLRNKLARLGIPRYKHNLAELGEMLPVLVNDEYSFSYKIEDGHWECGYRDTVLYKEHTEADARAKCLIFLLENNLLTPESL